MLTPDPELQAEGSETKIPYEKDYDFYLERLYKCSTWAIETMNFFNVGVFGNSKACEMSSELAVPSAPPRTWEDDFLDNLDSVGPPVQTTISTSTSVHLGFGNTSSVPGSSPPHSPHHSSPLSPHPSPPRPFESHSLPPGPGSLSHSDLPGFRPPHSINDSPESPVATSNAMVSIHNYPGASSAVSQLQVEVGQMSISGTQSIVNDTRMGSDQTLSSARRVSSRRPAPVPAQLPASSVLPVHSEPLVQKRVTRARTKAHQK